MGLVTLRITQYCRVILSSYGKILLLSVFLEQVLLLSLVSNRLSTLIVFPPMSCYKYNKFYIIFFVTLRPSLWRGCINSFFRLCFVPFPLSLCMESTSYVLSFRMVFFLPCDHGLGFSSAQVCENSIKSINQLL